MLWGLGWGQGACDQEYKRYFSPLKRRRRLEQSRTPGFLWPNVYEMLYADLCGELDRGRTPRQPPALGPIPGMSLLTGRKRFPGESQCPLPPAVTAVGIPEFSDLRFLWRLFSTQPMWETGTRMERRGQEQGGGGQCMLGTESTVSPASVDPGSVPCTRYRESRAVHQGLSVSCRTSLALALVSLSYSPQRPPSAPNWKSPGSCLMFVIEK